MVVYANSRLLSRRERLGQIFGAQIGDFVSCLRTEVFLRPPCLLDDAVDVFQTTLPAQSVKS